MKILRKIIKIDEELCDGCGLCVPSCAEGAIQIINGKAKVISDNLCDGLGACLGECPNNALSIVEQESEEFDEKAVEKHLEEKKVDKPLMECGCSSSNIQAFMPVSSKGTSESCLSHWPVKIRLVPANASFLKGADLLIVADCAPVAYPKFHNDLLKNKVVMMGCPKFDDTQIYVNKFAEIFKNAGLKSITIVFMEIPCCQGLPMIVKKAMKLSGVEIPVKEITLNTRGEILKPKIKE